MTVDISNGVAARHSSESAEHYTPAAIVEAARQTLGTIDLDPASCEEANATIRAARFHSEAENGFGREWHGRVFLNPPGGRCDATGITVVLAKPLKGYRYADGFPCVGPSQSSAKAWWFRLADEYSRGRVTAAVFVGFSLEMLQTTQVDSPPGLLLPLDASLCFPSRRISYVKPGGDVGTGPPHASFIAYLGPERERFAVAFGGFGKLVIR